jgi:hypothetical protein
MTPVTVLSSALLLAAALPLQAQAAEGKGKPLPDSQRTACARAYVAAALCTHNSAGPTSGWDKLLAQFGTPAPRGEWRECLMLRRLGFSEADNDRYMEEARGYETRT